ncbi:ribosome small subunit-dependent GTPase A [Gottschalkiaceae bacterium SANA]|nr:ribosome small subunit-dependent GTPase A [Gottschalkiaceae bacterium SANA]
MNQRNKNKSGNQADLGTNNKGIKMARIVRVDRGIYHLEGSEGIFLAELRGKFQENARAAADYPAVGDYVRVDRLNDKDGHGMIAEVLPRKSQFSRKVAGNRLDEQVVAANVDTVYVCMAMNHDFNLRRLERYLTQAWSSGASPKILLTKEDLCQERETCLREVEEIAFGIEVFMVSAFTGAGMEAWKDSLHPEETGVLLGSSGVGKSTLINTLLGIEHLDTQGLRNDDKGRHTTTHRELVTLPNGAYLIDTPGMRELQLLDDEVASGSVFSEIEALAKQCKFRNCSHQSEPGCAIQTALQNGQLSEDRWGSYQKILREQRFMEKKLKERERREEKSRKKRS